MINVRLHVLSANVHGRHVEGIDPLLLYYDCHGGQAGKRMTHSKKKNTKRTNNQAKKKLEIKTPTFDSEIYKSYEI